jgi:hypothetical protein
LNGGESLDGVADLEFFDHAHPAVELRGILADEAESTSNSRLSRRHGSCASARFGFQVDCDPVGIPPTIRVRFRDKERNAASIRSRATDNDSV